MKRRNWVTKLAAAGMAAILAAGMLTGCGTGSGESGGAKSNGKSIQIYAQTNGLGQDWLNHAAEAYRIGLVNKVVEPEALMDSAMAMARKIAKKAPIAVKYSKEAINRGMQTDIDSAIAIEANLFGLCFSTADQKEGMGAFLEKREAVYKNK